jgi:hypothetical protein
MGGKAMPGSATIIAGPFKHQGKMAGYEGCQSPDTRNGEGAGNEGGKTTDTHNGEGGKSCEVAKNPRHSCNYAI